MNAPISLYQLSQEYADTAHKLADLDLDDQTIADTLEGMSGALEAKATNVAMFAKNLEVMAEAIKQAEYEMAARRKAMENRTKSLREYLKANMLLAGISKIECPYFKMTIRDNPAAVVIDAESLIPADYMRQAEPPPPAPDKKLIAQAIKDGYEVPGCHLETSVRLEIK